MKTSTAETQCQMAVVTSECRNLWLSISCSRYGSCTNAPLPCLCCAASRLGLEGGQAILASSIAFSSRKLRKPGPCRLMGKQGDQRSLQHTPYSCSVGPSRTPSPSVPSRYPDISKGGWKEPVVAKSRLGGGGGALESLSFRETAAS